MNHFFKHLLCLLTICFLAQTSVSNATLDPIIGDDDGGGSAVWIHFLQARSPNGVIKVGKPLEIIWGTSFAYACSINSGAGGQQVPVNGSTHVIPQNFGEVVVTLTCVNEQGSQYSDSVTVDVKKLRHPDLLSVSLSPSANIPAGQSVELNWESEFAGYCELSGTHDENLDSNGSQSYTIVPGNNVFRVTCYRYSWKGDILLESNTIVKTVNGTAPAPIITNFYIQPLQSTYTLFWNSNSDYCLLDNVLTVPSNGGRSYQAAPFPVNHTLTCYRDGFLENRFITYYP